MAMARFFSLLVLCLLYVIAVPDDRLFQIQGRVYCDTCRCGFETIRSYYIHSATVRIECMDRKSLQVKFSMNATTDATGTYQAAVHGDHQDDMCYAMLVNSPVTNCAVKDKGRSLASLILTRDNGAISDLHFANAMGFLQDQPFSDCAELLRRKYLMYEDE